MLISFDVSYCVQWNTVVMQKGLVIPTKRLLAPGASPKEKKNGGVNGDVKAKEYLLDAS